MCKMDLANKVLLLFSANINLGAYCAAITAAMVCKKFFF